MRSTPRHNLTEPRSWFSIFFSAGGTFAVIAAVALLAFTSIAVFSYSQASRFDRDGIETSADIVDTRTRRKSEGHRSYYATFQFDVEGRSYRVEKNVSRSFHATHPKGATSTIYYLRTNPKKIEYFRGENHQDGQQTQFISGIAGIIALGALWYFGQRTNRAVLARQRGHRTVATVTEVVERKKKGKPTGKVYMTWRLADGALGKSLDRKKEELLALGTGSEIIVYVRKGESWWEGDVGPRHVPDSSIPKVRQDD